MLVLDFIACSLTSRTFARGSRDAVGTLPDLSRTNTIARLGEIGIQISTFGLARFVEPPFPSRNDMILGKMNADLVSLSAHLTEKSLMISLAIFEGLTVARTRRSRPLARSLAGSCSSS